MKITTELAEIGLLATADGIYELALYRRADNRMVRFAVDPALAWAISGAVHVPITAAPLVEAG